MSRASKKPLNIPNREYEVRRHASKLAAWVNRTLYRLGIREDQYFKRTGTNIKRLLEEALPLSRLGLYYWTPANQAYVTLAKANLNYDGVLEVEGFSPRSMRIEVTTCDSYESALRREALRVEGTVCLTGPIRRTAGKAVSEGAMIDVVEETDAVVQLAFSRLLAKIDSGKYDDNTAMLVYLSQYWPLPAEGRLELHRRARRYLEERDPPIPAIYFCYWPDYSIDAVGDCRARQRSR